jgi:nitrite reductase/ring-hydroxylating ferredoxin subunit
MTFERAARSEDVRGPRFLRVNVRGHPVLLCRLADGTPVAFGAICPHKGNPMDDGVLWGDEVDCPHHHYTYDPRTGENRYPSRVFPADKARAVKGIPVFDVREEDGWVFVGQRRKPSAS